MPATTPRTCPTFGCDGLWNGKRCTRCDRRPPKHGWQSDKWRGTSTQRGYDARWTRLRNAKARHDPLCESCLEEGLAVPMTSVDHVIPFKGRHDPLRLDWDNLQSLCEDCHKAKTVRER